MFNRNGNNGNGNGTGNGLVHVNGNGHKPDAIVTEHDLLWDGLSPAVTQALGQPLDPALVSQRKGRGGRVFDYLEGHAVIDQANRIFGFGGWGYELARRHSAPDRDGRPQTGEVTVSQAYSAPVRVTVAGALPRTDTGVHPVAEDTFDGHDTAIKGAGNGRHEAGLPQLRRPVRQRVLRRPAAGQRPDQAGARPRSGQRQVGPGPGQRPRPAGSGQPRRQPQARRCASGSSRWPPPRASTRTSCAPPSWTRRARASTT